MKRVLILGGGFGGLYAALELDKHIGKRDDVEVTLIRQALQKTGGNRSRAARLLGLTRDTLLYRLKKYAIE